jgi:hypothetical protein
MDPEPATCVACGTELSPIQVFETDNGRQKVLKYATADAKPGVWMGRIPTQGYLESWLCATCGRVDFYAVPKDS